MSAARPETIPAPVRVVTVRPAPRREPRFDDELTERELTLVGPHDRPLPFAPRRRIVEARDLFTPRPTQRGDLPDPEAFGRRLLVGIFEALGGRRSLPQLAAHLSHRVYSGLVSDLDRPGQRTWRTPPAIRSMRVCEPATGVAELAAVIQAGRRCRAVALRLEAHDGHWRCVRLQIG